MKARRTWGLLLLPLCWSLLGAAGENASERPTDQEVAEAVHRLLGPDFDTRRCAVIR